LEFVLHWLRARQPDVVGIQEIKLTGEQFPTAEIEAAGYHAVAHGQKAWNGVAILSREPAVVTRQGLPGQEDLGARLLTAEVGGLSFTTIYVPNGKSVGHEDFPRKLAWLDALREHLEAAHDPQNPVVLCGDFNICPAELDSWNEAMLAGNIFHTPDERERFKSLVDWGLIDLFRDVHPETQAFSWWDYRGGAFHRGQGLRIDFVLGTPAVRTRVRNVEIDRDYRKKKDGMISSDHTAVIVDLE
jgi:exodeoxyribonuclease-3